MNKAEFLSVLRLNLCGASEQDIKKAEDFYAEMIDDRVDSGMSEEEAVASLTPPEDAARSILLEMPLGKLIKTKARSSRKLSPLEIVLLILGFPVWGAFAVAALAIFLSVYLSLWAIVISLYAANLSVAVSVLACIVLSVVMFVHGSAATGVFVIGAAVACMGLAVLMFFGFNYVAKGLIYLSKLCVKGIKSLFVKRGDK